jgi:putative MATE family efflux protein
MDDHRLTDAAAAVNRSDVTELPGGDLTGTVPPRAAPPGPLDVRRPVWVLVLRLAWPVLVQQLILFTVSFVDRFLPGWFLPAGAAQIESQAAQTTAAYLVWFLSSFCVLVSAGATALVARLVGAGDRRGAVRAANQSVLLAAALGLGGGAAGYCLLPLGLEALGLRGDTAVFAARYLTPMFVLLPFQVVEQAGIACLVGAGDTLTGMLVLGGMAVLNLLLAPAFFFLRGFPGIGLGTAVAHTLGGLAVFAILARGRAGLWLRPGLMTPDFGLIWRILRVSLPAGADSLSGVAGHLVFLSIVNTLSEDEVAAHGIALQWESLSFLSGVAFGTAAAALVGQNLGARRPDLAARSGWTAFALGGGFMSLMGAIFFIFAPPMFGLFCPNPEQKHMIEVGVPVLRLVALAQPFLASANIFTAALRGAGDTRRPVLITWLGLFGVRLPLASLLTGVGPLAGAGLHLGLLGAWLAMFADLAVRGLFFLLRFAGGRWRHVRV